MHATARGERGLRDQRRSPSEPWSARANIRAPRDAVGVCRSTRLSIMAKLPVFISWSGRRSKAVANAMRLWLQDVVQGTQPWMSDSDIDKGSRWGQEVAEQLRESTIGIICVTPENLTSPWLLFEAGALSKMEGSYVCTLLFDIAPGAVPPPLGTFQATQANKEEVLKLLSTINQALGPDALSPEQLGRIFARSWPELDERLAEIKKIESETAGSQRRDPNELLEELVQLVRAVDAKLATAPSRIPIPDYPGQYPPQYPPAPYTPRGGSRASLGSQAALAPSEEFLTDAKRAVEKAERGAPPGDLED